MNISRTAWHYKLATYYRDTDPRSVCSYFWSMVGGLFVAPFAVFVICLMAFFVTAPIWGWFFGTPVPIMVVGALFDVIFIAGFVNAWLSDEADPVSRYIMAKKQKVCPLVEYNNEQK